MCDQDDDPKKYHVEEYKDVSSNLRQYANMRFAQLTLFVALSGALVSVAFKPATQVAAPRWIIRTAGIVLSLVFWLLEHRSTVYWIAFIKRAERLEDKLSFRQYKGRPKSRVLLKIEINATNAVRLLFSFSILFWLAHWYWHW